MISWSRTTTLVLLAVAACCRQGWYVAEAVLPAQDAVDVVCVAQRMEADGLVATMRAERVPPLFPAVVAGVHAAGHRLGLIELQNWAGPPQWVAAFTLIAAIFPIYLLTERLANRAAAVTATLFFIAAPALSRLGGDGLGDALPLALVAWSAWLLFVDRQFAAGLGIAAALLVRPEAAVVPLAMLLLAVRRTEFRLPRFFVAASLCVVPYLAINVTSPTDLIQRLRGSGAPSESLPLNAVATHAATTVAEQETFGRRDPGRSARFQGLTATLDEYVTELLQASGFVLFPLALVGIGSLRRSQLRPIDRFLLVAVGLHLAIVFVMAWRGGYLSTRHFALPVLLTLPYAAVGLNETCRRLAALRWNLKLEISTSNFQVAAVVLFVIASLIVTARPLHESQRTHRAAAAWLDSAASRPGAVLDQQGFTALYSGRPTYRFEASSAALADPQLAYVVVERGDLEADTHRGSVLRASLGDAERAVVTFAADRGRRPRDVLIFSRPVPHLASQGVYDAR